ncbi:MAG: hypothetical protein IPG50_24695 [Myxococcales bacterium]|nr:hypothetical protein [Myxococcales bacterium]
MLEANRVALKLLGRERLGLVGKPLIVSLGPDAAMLFHTHRRALLDTGNPQRVELSARTPDGRAPRLIVESSLLSTSPRKLLCPDRRRPPGAAEREKAVLERRIRETRRWRRGRLAASVAHVNNILVSVLSRGIHRSRAPRPGRDLNGPAAAWRGARLMRGLLGLSKLPAQARQVDLRGLVDRVLQQLARTREDVQLQASAEGPLPIVSGDEDRLYQAVLNVVLNAIQASRPSGIVRVTLQTEPPVTRLLVLDEGEGMSEETRQRAFEPLFTTKGPGRAQESGSRSPIVRSDLGGTIDLQSELGRGTSVLVSLPCVMAVEPKSEPPAERASPGPSWRVLLVDDDPSCSARPLEFCRGAAVTWLRGRARSAHGDGGPSGVRCRRRRRQHAGLQRPRIREALVPVARPSAVVFVTGSSGEVVPDEYLALPNVRLVRKPWSREDVDRDGRGHQRDPGRCGVGPYFTGVGAIWLRSNPPG